MRPTGQTDQVIRALNSCEDRGDNDDVPRHCAKRKVEILLIHNSFSCNFLIGGTRAWTLKKISERLRCFEPFLRLQRGTRFDDVLTARMLIPFGSSSLPPSYSQATGAWFFWGRNFKNIWRLKNGAGFEPLMFLAYRGQIFSQMPRISWAKSNFGSGNAARLSVKCTQPSSFLPSYANAFP